MSLQYSDGILCFRRAVGKLYLEGGTVFADVASGVLFGLGYA